MGMTLTDSRNGVGALGALFAAVGVGALAAAGLLQNVELFVADAILRRLPTAMSDAVVVVGIDEHDIQTLGRWPLSDDDLANLVEAIAASHPRAIGIDLYRDLAVSPGTERLARVLGETSMVYGVSRYAQPPDIATEAHPTLVAANRFGFANFPLDDDGRVRRLLLYAGVDGTTVESLSMRLAMATLEAEGIQPAEVAGEAGSFQLGAARLRPLAPDHGPYADADTGGFQVMLDYGAGTDGFRVIPARDVLGGASSSGLLRDRVVLLGSLASTALDVLSTPLDVSLTGTSRMYGVLVQANAIDQILRMARGVSRPLGAWSNPVELAMVATVAVAGAAVAVLVPSAVLSSATAMIGTVAFVVVAGVARQNGLWLPVAAPLLAWLVSLASTTVTLYYAERRERAVLMQMFGCYVSPAIADEMWRSRRQFTEAGRPISQPLFATVLFTDLQGFTSISEGMSGEALMAWLDRFMSSMTQIVHRHGGTVDKFIGDSVMAVFGVPLPHTEPAVQQTDALAAMRCAVEMGAALKSLNADLAAEGLPAVRMRVGIHSGTVIAGSLGSRERLQYTVIGDTVNTASRLESYRGTESAALDDERPIRILVGSSTHELTREEFACTFLGSLALKGKSNAIDVFQVNV